MAPRRSQARWLAPVALVACAFAVYAVARSGSSGDAASRTTGSVATTATTSTVSTTSTGTTSTPSTTATTRRRRYTIKAGDTLTAIAQQTGVPLETIIKLNPGLDSQTLQTGDTIKLAP